MPHHPTDTHSTLMTAEAEALTRQVSDMLADLTEQYPDWTRSELVAMTDFLNRAKSTDGDERFSLIRNDFFGKAHDIKGQGSTFGYPLMTDVGAFICDYLRHKDTFTDDDINRMQEMVDIMQTILENRLTGDGGEKGQSIRRQIGKDPQ